MNAHTGSKGAAAKQMESEVLQKTLMERPAVGSQRWLHFMSYANSLPAGCDIVSNGATLSQVCRNLFESDPYLAVS